MFSTGQAVSFRTEGEGQEGRGVNEPLLIQSQALLPVSYAHINMNLKFKWRGIRDITVKMMKFECKRLFEGDQHSLYYLFPILK